MPFMTFDMNYYIEDIIILSRDFVAKIGPKTDLGVCVCNILQIIYYIRKASDGGSRLR